jgi:ubiquinone biosynthesis accessory factor UbiJ
LPGAAYNHSMLQTLQAMLAPALSERLTLVINHVLNGEAVATERLRPHAGRSLALRLRSWPALLPAPPVLAWRITPAGLLEWCGADPATETDAAPDLAVQLDAPNPALLLAKALAGEMPAVQVEGDAQLAGDVNWLLQNLRWDVAADLERVFGPTLAAPLHTVGSALAAALRKAIGVASQGAQAASSVGEAMRPRGV